MFGEYRGGGTPIYAKIGERWVRNEVTLSRERARWSKKRDASSFYQMEPCRGTQTHGNSSKSINTRIDRFQSTRNLYTRILYTYLHEPIYKYRNMVRRDVGVLGVCDVQILLQVSAKTWIKLWIIDATSFRSVRAFVCTCVRANKIIILTCTFGLTLPRVASVASPVVYRSRFIFVNGGILLIFSRIFNTTLKPKARSKDSIKI